MHTRQRSVPGSLQPLRRCAPPPLTQGRLWRGAFAAGTQGAQAGGRAMRAPTVGAGDGSAVEIAGWRADVGIRPYEQLCDSLRRGRCPHRPEPAAGGSVCRKRGGNRGLADARCAPLRRSNPSNAGGNRHLGTGGYAIRPYGVCEKSPGNGRAIQSGRFDRCRFGPAETGLHKHIAVKLQQRSFTAMCSEA